MHIVKRNEFLLLPEGTIYSFYKPCGIVDVLFMKHETVLDRENRPCDWWNLDLLLNTDSGGTLEFAGLMDKAENDSSFVFRMPYDTIDRDGMYNKEQLFMVYDGVDVESLIKVLQMSLEGKWKE